MSTLRPNILFMLSDDHATEAVGAYRERLAPWAQTVRIDRLASQGILAERYFVTTSLCSPSRASIITGRYAHSHGVLGVGIYSLLKQDENPSLPAELQAAAGYETALFGKWHLHGDSGGGKRRWRAAQSGRCDRKRAACGGTCARSPTRARARLHGDDLSLRVRPFRHPRVLRFELAARG